MIENMYTPNELESEKFLSKIPLSLMKENIKTQFAEPLEHRKKDHVQTFIGSLVFSQNNADPYDDEEIDSYVEMRDDFYTFMRDLFQHYLGVGINDFEDMVKDSQDDLIHYTYRFFIINIRKNFISYIHNKINENRGNYKYEDKKKDVTSLSFKKTISDEDIEILSNLYQIISNILNNLDDVTDFFQRCDLDTSSLETRMIRSNYDSFVLTGNFTDKYKAMLDDNFKSEIETNIRNIILSKYAKDDSYVDIESEIY